MRIVTIITDKKYQQFSIQTAVLDYAIKIASDG